MPRFVIIENGALADSTSRPILEMQADCDWQRWESFDPESLRSSPAQLIVAYLDSVTERSSRFLHLLSQSLVAAPVLAVLAGPPDQELLRLVAAVADDFLFWPFREEELKLRVARILGTQVSARERVQNALGAELAVAQLVGKHPSFLRAVQQATLFGANDATVLITGETGTGKELFAHAVHSLGRRRSGPFIPLDCATLPEHLAENELFGHRRGAYTDAQADQKGLLAMADGGTLFLDEIDALSPANQSKLLRFLQDGSYRTLGSDRITRSNVRIIAATNRPIEELVRQRQFRSDLYFRINVLRFQLPPLRERRGDISLLAGHFLANECAGSAAEHKSFAASALRKLESYHWPGNVRELLNAVRRAFICCPGRWILPEYISLEFTATGVDEEVAAGLSFRSAKQMVIEKFERAYIEELLLRHQGNVTRAARDAGKERRAFGRLIKKHDLLAPPSRT